MRTRVKVCGLTRSEDIRAAIDSGVDAIGLVFYPHSPRAVSSIQAQNLTKSLPPYVQVVALFVDAQINYVRSICAQVAIDVLQFHGNESAEECKLIAESVNKRWYKALQVTPDLALNEMIDQYVNAGASAILLDAWHPDLKGGTGQHFDWQLWPKRDDVALILAGGLNPDNINQATRLLSPFAVDVSGGVEVGKGIKDAQLIQKFMQGVQSGTG